jgi:hypothetical protein
MRNIVKFLPLLLILAVFGCAKPPQAEIDAAKAAVAKAAQNPDVVTYASDSLKSAQTLLAQMQTELNAKHYDKVKSLAVQASAAAAKAGTDATKNKDRIKTEAAALIEAVKLQIPKTEKTISSARNVRGVKLDFAALSADLKVAQAALADAEADYAAGAFMSAYTKASNAQTTLADTDRTVTSAIGALSRKK